MTRLRAVPLSRRRLLRAAGAGVALGTGLFGGRAPARADEPLLHVVQHASFMPGIDLALQALAEEFGKAHGCRTKLEFINLNDVLPRTLAALEARYGPDVVLLHWNAAWRFDTGFQPVDDAVAAAGGDRIYRVLREAVRVNGVYRGVPFYTIGSAMTYNTALLAEQGLTRLPETLDELLTVGSAMKRAGHPVGWCLGHAPGDGPIGAYPLLWSFGGAEVDERGRVSLGGAETRAALEWFRQFWHDACDPAGLDWGDAGNNAAFLERRASIVLNAASICLKARADGDAALAAAMRHTPMPAGPAGRFHLVVPFSHHIPAYSRNAALAKAWLAFLAARPQVERVFAAGRGFIQGVTPEWETHPLWEADPVLAPFRELIRTARAPGYRGVYNRAAAEAQARFVLPTLFADAVREGVNPALARAEAALKAAYGGG